MEEIKENKIKEVIVDSETIYLKKDFLGWHTVHPIKNKDNSINWKNLISGGSWIRLFLIIVFVLICLGAMFEVADIIKTANECIKNQTAYSINNLNLPQWNLK